MQCLRYFFLITFVFITAVPPFCDWADDLFRVNSDTTGLQAPRNTDCPWTIAADDSGNVYTV